MEAPSFAGVPKAAPVRISTPIPFSLSFAPRSEAPSSILRTPGTLNYARLSPSYLCISSSSLFLLSFSLRFYRTPLAFFPFLSSCLILESNRRNRLTILRSHRNSRALDFPSIFHGSKSHSTLVDLSNSNGLERLEIPQ